MSESEISTRYAGGYLFFKSNIRINTRALFSTKNIIYCKYDKNKLTN